MATRLLHSRSSNPCSRELSAQIEPQNKTQKIFENIACLFMYLHKSCSKVNSFYMLQNPKIYTKILIIYEQRGLGFRV